MRFKLSNIMITGRGQAIKLEEGTPAKSQVLKVNGRYPEAAALPTVPPNLLARLPQLPEELEFVVRRSAFAEPDERFLLAHGADSAGNAQAARLLPEELGDPRDRLLDTDNTRARIGDLDIVDWIEHIPFTETRNYVMRVTESLPVYRARLGNDPLPIPFSAELTGSTLRAFAPKGE